jgi:hypothetical protein
VQLARAAACCRIYRGNARCLPLNVKNRFASEIRRRSLYRGDGLFFWRVDKHREPHFHVALIDAFDDLNGQ